MYIDSEGRGCFFESQGVTTPPPANSISFPTIPAASVNIRPHDIRSFLQESQSKSSSESLDCQFILRDSAVDLEAALEFEDRDPAPVSTVPTAFDLAQSVKSSNLDGVSLAQSVSNFDPVPSPLLLESIRSLLHPDRNTITFTVSSLIQGPKRATASLFLWQSNIRLVVSDVDGTVTSSDLMGHIMPTFGRDWTHPGLAGLYTAIAREGVRFVYLSSRPIGEAPITRTMLQKIDQGGNQMPDGPIITTPDALFAAVTRELKRKPQDFKIPTLQAISALFSPLPSPFTLGFGNRQTDVISYRGIGLDDDRIMLFNPKHKVMDCNGKVIFEAIADLTPHITSLLRNTEQTETSL
jgi:phosphatidate phosphatase LPIN